jgi:galactose-1-phosphate uridylyltransferase
MVGYELLSELQRDITAEDAAEQLRRAGEAED